MKKFHLIMLAFLLALLALGQAGCQREKGAEVGIEGVVLKEIPEAPPSQISRGEEFPIMVALENKGGYDVKKGEVKVFVEGLEPSLFSLAQDDLEKENSKELKKAVSNEGISGGRERIIFSEKAKYVGQNVNFEQPLAFVSCYDYETEAQTNICFSFEGNVCSLSGEKIEETDLSDGPIQITSVIEERSGQNVQVRFKIENKGNGRVFLPTANCKDPEAFLENSVLVSVESDEPFDCRPSLSEETRGEARVNSIIVCKRNMEDVTEHVSPVKFRVRYKYFEVFPSSIKVTE